MKQEPDNKCKELGLHHAWKNTTKNMFYTVMPPRSPDKEETCKNCNLKRTYRSKIEEWLEYS